MEIVIQGDQSAEEAAECLASIIALFHERYGIDYFREISLNVGLIDEEGENVELIDPETSETYDWIEVYKAEDYPEEPVKPFLRLVVDNT